MKLRDAEPGTQFRREGIEAVYIRTATYDILQNPPAMEHLFCLNLSTYRMESIHKDTLIIAIGVRSLGAEPIESGSYKQGF